MVLGSNPALWFYHWFWVGIDLIFPPICGGCGVGRTRWCGKCHESVDLLTSPVCEVCGRRLTLPGLCATCQETSPHFTALRSWAIFTGPVRNALHEMKYRRNIGLGEVMAHQLLVLLRQQPWQVETIVPVPLGKSRLKERGYNQAALFAWPLANNAGLQYHPKALKRTRETSSQVGLSLLERRNNVQGAFTANPDLVKKKSILLVDDVATSGATLDACAEALLKGGASSVYGFTIARAHKFTDV